MATDVLRKRGQCTVFTLGLKRDSRGWIIVYGLKVRMRKRSDDLKRLDRPKTSGGQVKKVNEWKAH